MAVVLSLLRTFSWQELRHHPWRNAAAVLAVTLGVALAFSVHLINASALDEFAGAVRTVNGQPDLTVRAASGKLDEALYAQLVAHPQVALASPVLEVATVAFGTAVAGSPSVARSVASDEAEGKVSRLALRIVAIDALVIAAVAPALMPRLDPQADRLAMLAPATVFLNDAAARALGSPGLHDTSGRPDLPRTNGKSAAPGRHGDRLTLQTGLSTVTVHVAGSVVAGGAPLAVMDIGAAQDLFGRNGELSRIDLRLQPGTDAAAFVGSLRLPAGVSAQAPGDDARRVSNLSRAYRVNLTVLALVALFTGAFLVWSVLSLSVAQRAQQLALLGVLGLTPAERLRLVLVESLLLGAVGSAAGVALGTALAALALRLLGGDLGGGYFAGVAPALRWDGAAALLYGTLGVAAAGAGGWWPARDAGRLPPAQTLKGLGTGGRGNTHRAWPAGLIIAGVLLAQLPPIAGLPLAAYVSVGLLLVGGITALPWLIALGYDRLAPLLQHRLLPLLAVERARRIRESAAVAISGVVASLALSVALTVMVASFRDSVTQWLDGVLPADLYVRAGASASTADAVPLPPGLAPVVARLAGVRQVGTQRSVPFQLDPARPAVTLISRDLGDPARSLALVGQALPVPAGQTGVWVSEAMAALYGLTPGSAFPSLSMLFVAQPSVGGSFSATFFVAGVWRDYARQSGAVVMDRRDYERLSGDRLVNDLAIWLTPDADPAQVQTAVREAARVLACGTAQPTNFHESSATPPMMKFPCHPRLDRGSLPPLAWIPGQAGNDRKVPPYQDKPAEKTGVADANETAELLEFAAADQIRARSLRIFDRSFAVTYWLQAVAIAIGLFGVAASFGAQVLARRKEFGLLAHLGLTRRQILAVVAGEGAAWTAMGALAGLALGLAVSVVLVHVVNPQSFHWTMELSTPWLRLLALCAAVVVAGTLTAWLAGRAAAGRDAVLAVKEDW